MILDLLHLEDKIRLLEGGKKAGGKDSARLVEAAGSPGEIGRLKRELEARDRDIATLKKQAEGLSREYHKLGDQLSTEDGTPKKDR